MTSAVDEHSLAGLRGQVVRSTRVLRELTSGITAPDEQIPRSFLRQACGLALVTQLKAGLLISGAVGSGLVVRREAGGRWSMPVSVFTLGGGIGAQVGGRVTDAVVVLFEPEAVDAFCARGQLKLGVDAAVAIGPLGRDVSADLRLASTGASATCFSYAHSKGLYEGLSLEAEVLMVRDVDNADYYEQKGVAARDILDGRVCWPRDNARRAEATALYELLDEVSSNPAGTSLSLDMQPI